MMKRRVFLLTIALAFILALSALTGACAAEDIASRDILAVYSCPNSQITTNADDSKELADTVIYLYTDAAYVQYILHEGRYEIYSMGDFSVNFGWDDVEWGVGEPHIMTIHVTKLHQADHELLDVDLSYDVDLDRTDDYCLYPDNIREDAKLVAAFMQADKQRLVRTDGTEEYLPTMWFYYDDGTFQQYALNNDEEDVLFSTGDYSMSNGGFTDAGAILTLHRSQKYQDGVGLADYDSTHDYEIGSLGFIRIYPESDRTEGGIDYLALVNKLHPLPEGWEDALETVTITNSVGDDVEAEARAYAAYELLRADLEANDGIYIELDSARRSVAEQQDIMDRFIEKYGANYAAKTVAQPGYSEHHTGLALDLYFKLKGDDGTFTDVYYNEDMVQYPGIWEKIHAKLADYGFILRYLPGKEHITGYGYEPWHIRYVGSPEIAREIMSQPGMTLEVYLGAVNDTDPTIDSGESTLYTEGELAEAAVQIKCKFASFEGCELHALRYAGDDCNSGENLAWLNGLDEGKHYIQVAEFLSDFHSPAEDGGAWEADTEYTDWQWWLAREEGGGWELLTWGY